MICAQADVRLVPKVTNPWIFLCEEAADFLCPIRRCVVTDNQFEILEGLLEKPRQGILEIPLAVINRQADADSWVPRFHSILFLRPSADCFFFSSRRRHTR